MCAAQGFIEEDQRDVAGDLAAAFGSSSDEGAAAAAPGTQEKPKKRKKAATSAKKRKIARQDDSDSDADTAMDASEAVSFSVLDAFLFVTFAFLSSRRGPGA